jgi:hypothetical protein
MGKVVSWDKSFNGMPFSGISHFLGQVFSWNKTFPRLSHIPNQVLLDFRISELYNVTETSSKQPYTLLPAKYIIVLLFSFFQSDFENRQ